MDKITNMKAFSAVVLEGSFANAALRLNLSAQLVSKYVSQLENSLHTRLLNRTTRKVSLTEAGSAYWTRCQQILIDIEEMENALSNSHQRVSGVLTISAPMSFGVKHLPKLLVDFQRRYADLKIDLKLTDRKIDIVEEGIDIALRIGDLKSSSLIAKRLTAINIAICASPDYLARNGTPATPQELAGHAYLKYSYSEKSSLFAQFNSDARDPKLNGNLLCNNGDLLVNAAIYGGGIVIQPTFIIGEALRAGQLTKILTEYAPSPLSLYAVYAHRQFLASKVRCFIDFIADYYGARPYWDQE
ncbi:MAG: DNA-binding transcriptional LysR family regulator [Psychromonas sp.]|jgi:DNA-binding transcriptional LysR family regulator|uniref:LysR family transcriptional regulator n=1 Tax=Psychromonas sp. TaxID=1884585 RepID=UPI0039E4D31E